MSTQRFNPIFTVTVTPASVRTGTAQNGNKYALMQNATVSREGREPKTMTVMAFGKARDEVASFLRKGKSVNLAVQHDGGSLKVIGLPRAKAA